MVFDFKRNNFINIKVVGVGGGGGNAVNYMFSKSISGVDFYVVNTDIQDLLKISVKKKIQIGKNITKGLGAGSNPEIGKNSAEEDKNILKSILDGADMLFIASCMGGGTGTGASPVIARIAKELNILTVAVVTKPFSFEGKKRMCFADYGIYKLSKLVDSLIIIPNDKLLKVFNKDISLLNAFNSINNILKNAVQGISDLITKPSLINVDFADICTVMSKMGYSIMGTGFSFGDNRALKAIKSAISSPLIEDIDLSTVKGILVNISSGLDLKLEEFEIIGNSIRSFSSENTTIVIGTSLDINMNGKLHITLIATGISTNKYIDINLSKGKIDFFKKKNRDFQTIIVNKRNSFSLEKENINFNDFNIPTYIRKKIN